MNFELLKENRSQGWASAETAPDWAKDRIIEVRTAQAAKLTPPAPSREYIAAAEKRFLSAATFANRMFANRKSLEQRYVELTGRDPWEKQLRQVAVNRQAKQIVSEQQFLAEENRRAAELAETARINHRRWFPWER